MIRSTTCALSLLVLALSASSAQQFTVSKANIGGSGGTDYITAEPGTGRVFISRGTHVMVVDGASQKVIGEIANTPRVHGIALARNAHHGFTTNDGDSTVTMFDLQSLAVLKRVKIPAGGLDGIMYDAADDRVVLTNHSHPVGTAVALNPVSGAITGTAQLEDDAPEGAASDGKGRIFVNNEGRNTIQVIDARTMKVLASWPIAPCDGPTGIAYDSLSDRVFSGCSGTSVVVNGTTGKVVATIPVGDGVDALGWDPTEKLMYIPAGRDGTVTVVHQDSPDRYRVVATVPTMRGARTIAVDPVSHTAYLLTPEYGPAPADAPATARGPARGPVIAAWLFAIRH